MSEKNAEQELKELEQKINIAQSLGQPINNFVLREIEILQNELDIFLKKMAETNKIEDTYIIEIKIRQYSTMRNLAKKINLPTDKYDKLIKDAKIRVFGEENYKHFFEN